jgi:hypothetical protein
LEYNKSTNTKALTTYLSEVRLLEMQKNERKAEKRMFWLERLDYWQGRVKPLATWAVG